MSNKREREKRREERERQESHVQTEDRRKKLLQIGSAAVFLVIVAVVVLVIASSGGGGGGEAENLQEIGTVDQLVEGIPQKEMVLGDPKAKVRLIEFGDLQCPVCKSYSEEILPQIIEGPVKQGDAQIEFRNFTIIGPQSLPAGAAALAAGKQGRGWEFLELFYRNQGEENGGYVTDDFLTAVAKGAGVKNISQWDKERNSKALESTVQKTTEQAQNYGFTGTPSFAVEGPNAKGGIELLGTPGSAGDIEKALESAG